MSRLAESETVMMASALRAATFTKGRFSSDAPPRMKRGYIVRLMS